MNEQLIAQLINLLLVGISGLRQLGVDYQRVIALQEQANTEGRTLTQAERAQFLMESRAAIERL